MYVAVHLAVNKTIIEDDGNTQTMTHNVMNLTPFYYVKYLIIWLFGSTCKSASGVVQKTITRFIMETSACWLELALIGKDLMVATWITYIYLQELITPHHYGSPLPQ